IQVIIISNTLILMVKWYREPDYVNDITETMNLIFTLIFAIEAFIRIVAIGFSSYFDDGWNLFDFVVAVGSIAGLIISKNTELSIKATTLLRAFRILRLLRLLKRGG